MAKRARSRKSLKGEPRLLDLIERRRQRVLEVLDRHGVYFDPGTLITLTSSLEKVAAFHAVPDYPRFLKDLKKAVGG